MILKPGSSKSSDVLGEWNCTNGRTLSKKPAFKNQGEIPKGEIAPNGFL